MRTTPRPRRPLNPVALALLRPMLRYSYTREAYVLRGIGNHRGPVFVRTGVTTPAIAAPAADGARSDGAVVAGPVDDGPTPEDPATDGASPGRRTAPGPDR
jgi:hypothetical protein